MTTIQKLKEYELITGLHNEIRYHFTYYGYVFRGAFRYMWE